MSIINKKEVKRVALEKGREKYKNVPIYIPTRVSEAFLQEAETALLLWIDNKLASRPTKGVTI